MDVVLYRINEKDRYIYDMSLNPDVDFEILKRTRGIKSLTVLTSKMPVETAEDILKRMYGTSGIIRKLPNSQEYILNFLLKKFNIKISKREITFGEHILEPDSISKVEECITGRIISIRQLAGLKTALNMKENEIINAVQALYCERRIKMIPSVRKHKDKEECSFCKREPCDICSFKFQRDDILVYAADNYNFKGPRNIYFKIANLSEPLKRAYSEFISFIKSKKDSAVLWCAPGSFEYSVLTGGICEILKPGGKVLFITSSSEVFNAAEEFKKLLKDIKICMINKNYEFKNADIIINSINNYFPYYKAFDAVIFDRRFSFAKNNFEDLEFIYKKAVKERGKFIIITSFIPKNIYSLVKASLEIIPLPALKSGNPIPEPRIEISRFLRGERLYITSMASDIIKWSIIEDCGVIIFVPDEEVLSRVYYYLTFYERYEKDEVDISTEKYKEGVLKLAKKQIKILISSDFKDAVSFFDDVNVIVMNSDDKIYNAEALINMASIASHSKYKNTGEVLFVACEETETMSLAKAAIRNMNKTAWERGYIKK